MVPSTISTGDTEINNPANERVQLGDWNGPHKESSESEAGLNVSTECLGHRAQSLLTRLLGQGEVVGKDRERLYSTWARRMSKCQAKSKGTGIPNREKGSCKVMEMEWTWLVARSSSYWVRLEHVGKWWDMKLDRSAFMSQLMKGHRKGIEFTMGVTPTLYISPEAECRWKEDQVLFHNDTC